MSSIQSDPVAQRIIEGRGRPDLLTGEGPDRGIGALRRGSSNKVAAFISERVNNMDYNTHVERFLQRPLLNADYTPTAADDGNDGATEAELLLMSRGNKNFEVVGTNGVTASTSFLEGGGIRLTTAGAAADQVIIAAHLDPNASALAGMNWDSANEPAWFANIVTGPAAIDLVTTTIWGGFKLSNVSVVITDDEQAIFRVANGASGSPGNWTCVQSVGGVDVTFDTGITCNFATNYQLLIVFDENRIPIFYINGARVYVGTAMADVSTLDPYLGIQDASSGGVAVDLDVRNYVLSQLYG